MPPLTEELLARILKTSFPEIKTGALEQFSGLFLDLQLKAQNSEISTKPMDLRGLLAAVKVIKGGICPQKAINMGITNKCFDIFEREMIEDIVMTRIPASWTAGDVESIVATAPDLVFTDMSSEGGTALCTMLDQLAIPYVVVAENQDTGSEAYLEWLKFFGAFYNLDEKADSLYEEKLDHLEELYRKVASIPEADRPVVAFGMVFDGIVYTQSSSSSIAKQLDRAGAVYALQDLEGDGVVQLGMEEFLDKCRDADILIYDSLPMYMQGTLLDENPLFAEFKAYQNQRVYTMDNGYYMNSAKVVEKFEDLLAMCHPDLAEGHVFTVYQPLQNY